MRNIFGCLLLCFLHAIYFSLFIVFHQVSDGVGGWQDCGVTSKEFAEALVHNISDLDAKFRCMLPNFTLGVGVEGGKKIFEDLPLGLFLLPVDLSLISPSYAPQFIYSFCHFFDLFFHSKTSR